MADFTHLNRGFETTFKVGDLTLGLVVPMENYPIGGHPRMEGHLEKAQLAESLGFRALWLRDVPFEVPNFGDVGQTFDPFVYLGALSIATKDIALGVASLILPLRHPAHVAKAAASVDVLSGGRLVLGVASGDRPEEYPAMGIDYHDRGAAFRDCFDYIRALAGDFPQHQSSFGALSGGVNILPKPTGARIPMLITGGSWQDPEWVAEHSDGWITYPRDVGSQAAVLQAYRERASAYQYAPKPVMQSLYVDMMDDADARPRSIHLGFQSGTTFLLQYLQQLKQVGVNHVAINLRLNRAGIEDTMKRLSDDVIAHL